MKYINNKHAMTPAASLDVLGARWPLTSGFLLLAQPVLHCQTSLQLHPPNHNIG